ncbi:MAG: hypothetical protein K0S47_551 [Herbinix sp.]|jgi:MinD superfamily P-loop ATPase|nr:hypothetical protein [Herbinix sp.]
MPRKIDQTKCAGCGVCERVCIIGCITKGDDRKRMIMDSACVDCGACQLACPIKCISR